MDKYFPKLKATSHEIAIAMLFGAILNNIVPEQPHRRLLGAMRLIDNCQCYKSVVTVAHYCSELIDDLDEWILKHHGPDMFKCQSPMGWIKVFNYKIYGKLMELKRE